MTKNSWKYVFCLIIGLLVISAAGNALAQSNAATEEDIELFFGSINGKKENFDTTKEHAQKKCDEAKKKFEEIKAELNKARNNLDSALKLSPTADMGGLMINSMNAKNVDEEKIKEYQTEVRRLKAEFDRIEQEKNQICSDLSKINRSNPTEIYSYTNPDGSVVFMEYDSANKTAYALTGVTRGCIPLPVKLAEGKSCVFCPLFLKIFNAAQRMTDGAYSVLANAFSNIILLGFAIWVAFSLLGKVSSFTKMDAPKYITELLTQAFKVLVAFLLLRDSTVVYNYILGPLLKAGIEFGMTLLSTGNNSYLQACEGISDFNEPSSGLWPSYIYTQLECLIKAIQAELAVPEAIGSSLMCVSRKAGGIDMGALTSVTDFRFPDLSMMFEGLVIWIFAWLVALAFAFYLIDATVRLGIIGALMPFLVASWPFKITSKYTKQGFTMFMNTFFTYAFMGLVISINIQLLSESMTGVSGGKDAVISALNGDQVSVLHELLDIGFAGFLILIASCIFGFKLTGQATELAGGMAGGGSTGAIAPAIGGMGYNLAKATTLGAGKMAWGGTKLVGNATGITPKLRQAKDRAVAAFGKIFSLGRSGGGNASAPQLSGSHANPTPTPTPSSGGYSHTTPDQIRQAESVANANPRPDNQQPAPENADNTNTPPDNQQPAPENAGNTASANPEEAREQKIDQFNRQEAARLDVENNSTFGKQLLQQIAQAQKNGNSAGQLSQNYKTQAGQNTSQAKLLREKAQQMSDGDPKDALLKQADAFEKEAAELVAKAAEQANKEKEFDAMAKGDQKTLDEMMNERAQNISPEEIDNIMKQRYGTNYRAEQSANKGWKF